MTAPRRRRFRFGLRTMFVVVTLLSAIGSWFGYYANWIRARHETTDIYTAGGGAFGGPLFATDQEPAPYSFPIGLRLLGERPVRGMIIEAENRTEADNMRATFPEAHLIWPFNDEWDAENNP